MSIGIKPETTRRRPGFQPGKSGNPSGRPKVTPNQREFEALARSKSPLALERLEAISRGRGIAAVKALELLLGYAWGRPQVNVTATAKLGPLDNGFVGAARRALEEACAPKGLLEEADASAETGETP